jgi:hypothetical protein
LGPKEALGKVPEVRFDALRLGIFEVESTPPRLEAAPDVAMGAKPATVTAETEPVGRLTVPAGIARPLAVIVPLTFVLKLMPSTIYEN